jgi:hypothetical protein
MNDILLLDNHEKTRRLYSINLEAYTGANVIEVEKIEDAVEYLDDYSPSIVIARSKIDQRNAADRVANILKQKNEEISLIIVGDSNLSNYEATLLKEPIDLKALVQECAKILNVTARDMASTEVSDYYPIPLYLLLPGFQLICSLYKISSKGVFKEFLKPDHHVHQEVLVMLKEDDVDTVYVKALDRLRFINSLTVQTTELLRNDNISIEEKLRTVEQSHQMVRNMAKKMVIESETIQMAEASIDTMVSITDQIPTLKSILDLTMKNQMGLIYKHCLLISFISSHILKVMEWGTRDQQVKLAFVAFFHDISLQSDDHVKIHSQEELDAANLSEKDKEKIDKHALRSAKFLSRYYRSIPLGTDIIVKQHHGSRNGIGLDNLSQNISPLAIVFIIAEEWAMMAIKNEETDYPMEKTQAVEYLKRKYNLPAFKKVLSVLEKLSF